MGRGPLVAQWWRFYRTQVLHPDAPQVQVAECRTAFYAGCSAMFLGLVHGIDHDAEDAGVGVMSLLQRELDAFAAEQAAKAAGSKSKEN